MREQMNSENSCKLWEDIWHGYEPYSQTEYCLRGHTQYFAPYGPLSLRLARHGMSKLVSTEISLINPKIWISTSKCTTSCQVGFQKLHYCTGRVFTEESETYAVSSRYETLDITQVTHIPSQQCPSLTFSMNLCIIISRYETWSK